MNSKLTRLMTNSVELARRGRPARFSRIMQEAIPFNRPHRITVTSIGPEGCSVLLPDRRRNRNHLGTMHACAMATAAEFVSGLNVIEAFDISLFRLIMSRLDIEYIRRPSGACRATSSWEAGKLDLVKSSLKSKGIAKFKLTSSVVDSKGLHVATAEMHWQVKSWDQVRVK